MCIASPLAVVSLGYMHIQFVSMHSCMFTHTHTHTHTQMLKMRRQQDLLSSKTDLKSAAHAEAALRYLRDQFAAANATSYYTSRADV